MTDESDESADATHEGNEPLDTAEQPLAAVVEKPRTETAIDSLRAEGVYDAGRKVREYGEEAVTIPVTGPPAETRVLDVVRQQGARRLRTLGDHLEARGWTEEELARAPGSWAVIGSVVLVEISAAPRPTEVGEALLALHENADTVLARGGIDGEQREPDVEVLAGDGDTETIHTEHGIRYALDFSEVMFSPGNKAERARMGDAASAGERVFDMFAGIGYFTLPMARAGARVTATEINPASFRYLVENARLNDVHERVDLYRADCRDVAETVSADRVVMGYYDASEPRPDDSQTESDASFEYLDSALAALEPGGVLHMHEATPEQLVWERPIERLETAAAEAGRFAEVLDRHRVKGYSEGVAHVVVDARIE